MATLVRWILIAAFTLVSQHAAAKSARWIEDNFNVEPTQAQKFSALIDMEAQNHNIRPEYIYAIIAKESRYRPRAVGDKRFYGLGQIHYRVHSKRFFGKSPFDPAANINVTASIFQEEFRACRQNYRCALEQYNRSASKKKYAEKILRIVRSM